MIRFNRWFVFYFILFNGVSLSFSDHPFYLSVTEIKYNDENAHYELSFRLFIDDFELCLSNEEEEPVHLFEVKDSLRNDQLIMAYIAKHFQLTGNGNKIDLFFVGFEKEDQAIWCYFESDAEMKPTQLKIQNSLLYDKIESQTNIIHFNIDGKRYSYKLDNPELNYEWEKE